MTPASQMRRRSARPVSYEPRPVTTELVLPEQAKSFAASAGWKVLWDETIDVSAGLEDGRIWEISHAFWMGEALAESNASDVNGYAREAISSELDLLASLRDDAQVEWLMTTGRGSETKSIFTNGRTPIEASNTSLPTHVFLAE